MSLRFRTVSNKFTSLVNTRKQITKLDRQLPQNVKSSSFLDEFLGLQTSVNTKANFSKRNLDDFTDAYLIYQNRQPTSIKSLRKKEEKALAESYMKNKKTISYIKQQGLTNHNTLKNVELISVADLLLHKMIIDYKEKKSTSLTRNITFVANNDIDNVIHNSRYFFDKNISVTIMDTNPKQSTTSVTSGTFNMQQGRNEQLVPKDENRPSREHLEHIFQCLDHDLPLFFTKTLDYTIYSPDIIFVNNIKGTTTKGLANYVKQAALLKAVGHIKFAYVKFQVLKITIEPDDDSIKVRWRIRGVTGLGMLVSFCKRKIFKSTDTIKNADVWYDGFSTFYVGADGKVNKHVADKLMPDQDHLYEKEKTPVVTKLALFNGLGDLRILNSTEFISK